MDNIFGLISNSNVLGDYANDFFSRMDDEFGNIKPRNIVQNSFIGKNKKVFFLGGTFTDNVGFQLGPSDYSEDYIEDSVFNSESFTVFFRGNISNRKSLLNKPHLFLNNNNVVDEYCSDAAIYANAIKHEIKNISVVNLLSENKKNTKKIHVDLINILRKCNYFFDGNYSISILDKYSDRILLYSKSSFFHIYKMEGLIFYSTFEFLNPNSKNESDIPEKSFDTQVILPGFIFEIKNLSDYNLYSPDFSKVKLIPSCFDDEIILKNDNAAGNELLNRNLVLTDFLFTYCNRDIDFAAMFGGIDLETYVSFIFIGIDQSVAKFLNSVFISDYGNFLLSSGFNDLFHNVDNIIGDVFPVVFENNNNDNSAAFIHKLILKDKPFVKISNRDNINYVYSPSSFFTFDSFACRDFGFNAFYNLIFCYFFYSSFLISKFRTKNNNLFEVLSSVISELENDYIVEIYKFIQSPDRLFNLRVICDDLTVDIVKLCCDFISKYFDLNIVISNISDPNCFSFSEKDKGYFDILCLSSRVKTDKYYKYLNPQKMIEISSTQDHPVLAASKIMNFFQNFACNLSYLMLSSKNDESESNEGSSGRLIEAGKDETENNEIDAPRSIDINGEI